MILCVVSIIISGIHDTLRSEKLPAGASDAPLRVEMFCSKVESCGKGLYI